MTVEYSYARGSFTCKFWHQFIVLSASLANKHRFLIASWIMTHLKQKHYESSMKLHNKYYYVNKIGLYNAKVAMANGWQFLCVRIFLLINMFCSTLWKIVKVFRMQHKITSIVTQFLVNNYLSCKGSIIQTAVKCTCTCFIATTNWNRIKKGASRHIGVSSTGPWDSISTRANNFVKPQNQ